MGVLSQMKATAVGAGVWLLYVTGILGLLFARRVRDRAVVLMYHRVVAPDRVDDVCSHPGIVVKASTFDAHLRFLRRHMQVTTVERFVDHLARREPFPPRTCLITFDDGWEDNYTQAFPLLRRHDLPALIFLAVDFVGGRARFWQETLIDAVVRGVRSRSQGQAQAGDFGNLLSAIGLDPGRLCADDAGKARIQDAVCALKHSSVEARAAILAESARLTGTSQDSLRHCDGFLDWAQVHEMAAARISFGSHSCRHELLTDVEPEDARHELARSREVLQRELGERSWTVSYPNGSHNAAVRRIAQEEGYSAAFGTESGLVAPEDDRFAIRRINVHEGASSSVPLLMARIAGLI